MSETPIDELIGELNKVDLKKSQVKDSINYQNVLEKNCCNDLKRFQCKTHFLTPQLMTTVCESLNSSNSEKRANAANLIAELGKYDTCRDYIVNPTLVKALVPNLKSTDINVLIQTCRALANICYEKVQGQSLILENDGLTVILNLLQNSTVPNRLENNPNFKAVAIGLLLNLIADNETIQKKVLENNYMSTLLTIIKDDLKDDKATTVSQNIFVILVTLTECTSVETIFTQEVCDLAVEMFRNSYKDDLCVSGLDFLEDANVPDAVKLNLAQAGLFQLFLSFLEKKCANPAEEEIHKYDLTGRVLANILTGDEAMEYLYDLNDGEIMTRLTRWLSSEDKEMAYTAVLCIGNIARTDKHSTDIVGKEIHKLLMNLLKNDSNDIKVQYAILSTIRNLSIPRPNKTKLVEDGLVGILLPMINLDLKTSSPVIFKLVGTLRQIIDGQEPLAIELGCNEKLIIRLVTWAQSTICPWVSSECCRLLCWFVKISKDKRVMFNILRSGGYEQILKMLGALHGVMQSEAVSALAITSALVLLEKESNTKAKDSNDELKEDRSEDKPPVTPVNIAKKDGNFEITLGETITHSDDVAEVEEKFRNLQLTDYDVVLLNGNVGEKLSHLIQQHGVRMDEHILENIFTLLEIVVKLDKVRDHFNQTGLKNAFRMAMQARSDYSRFRFRIEEIEKSF